MKNLILYTCLFILVHSCISEKNTDARTCEVKHLKIENISEGSSFDIVLNNNSDSFYINRGIEKGLNLDSLKQKVLNKNVTLHVSKILFGLVTTKHIAQLKVNDEIVYSELK